MAKLFTLRVPMFEGHDEVQFEFIDRRFGFQVHFPNLQTETGNPFILPADVGKDGTLTPRLEEVMLDIYCISQQYEWTHDEFLTQVLSWFPKTIDEMVERVRKEADDWIQEVRQVTA